MACSCLRVLCQAQYGPGPDPDAQECQGHPDLQGRRVQLCGFGWAMLLSAKFREQATACSTTEVVSEASGGLGKETKQFGSGAVVGNSSFSVSISTWKQFDDGFFFFFLYFFIFLLFLRCEHNRLRETLLSLHFWRIGVKVKTDVDMLYLLSDFLYTQMQEDVSVTHAWM